MVTYQKPKRKLISDVGDNFTPGKTNISKSEHVKNSIHTVYFLRISKTKIYLKKKKKKNVLEVAETSIWNCFCIVKAQSFQDWIKLLISKDMVFLKKIKNATLLDVYWGVKYFHFHKRCFIYWRVMLYCSSLS